MAKKVIIQELGVSKQFMVTVPKAIASAMSSRKEMKLIGQ